MAVNEILQTTEFGSIENGEYGIDRLVSEGIFSSAYPLHDGSLDKEDSLDHLTDTADSEFNRIQKNPRWFLLNKWAKYTNFFKSQPLNQIRNYFGEKIGFYFAWLGTYTMWLLVPSIVGIFIFINGLINRQNDPTM